jgi:hypothetical protein
MSFHRSVLSNNHLNDNKQMASSEGSLEWGIKNILSDYS